MLKVGYGDLCLVWWPWLEGVHHETLTRDTCTCVPFWFDFWFWDWLKPQFFGMMFLIIMACIINHQICFVHGNHSFDKHVYMLGTSSNPRPYSSIHTYEFYLVIPSTLILSLCYFQVYMSLVFGVWFTIVLVFDLVVHCDSWCIGIH